MKKQISLLSLTILLLVSTLLGCGKQESTSINVGALIGPTSMGLVKLMNDSDTNQTDANEYSFTLSGTPDEITPALIQGELQIAAVPANLAAVLYAKSNGQIQVLAVNTLGVLYIVENGDSIQSVSDLKDKTIYASGKGSTPEYALTHMLEANGIVPVNDVNIEFCSEHAECLSRLNNDENGVAMLPQPFVTAALAKNENTRIAIDINEEWQKVSSDTPLITGVIVARTDFIDEHPDAVRLFLEQYEASIDYTNSNIEDASLLIDNYGIIDSAVASKAIPYCNITFIAGEQMKEQLSNYLEILHSQNPAAVGENLPDENFYYLSK